MSEKIIDEFESMINEVCGEVVKLEKEKYYGIATQDFYNLPFQHEDFMKWYKEKEEERNALKQSVECTCGERYIVYTMPDQTYYNYNNVSYDGTYVNYASTSTQSIIRESFFCYRCGRRFDVTGSVIIKLKSEKLEVGL